MTWKDNDFDAGDSPVRLTGVVREAGPRRVVGGNTAGKPAR